MYFVPHFGHAKVYETSIWTPCFPVSAAAALKYRLEEEVICLPVLPCVWSAGKGCSAPWLPSWKWVHTLCRIAWSTQSLSQGLQGSRHRCCLSWLCVDNDEACTSQPQQQSRQKYNKTKLQECMEIKLEGWNRKKGIAYYTFRYQMNMKVLCF